MIHDFFAVHVLTPLVISGHHLAAVTKSLIPLALGISLPPFHPLSRRPPACA
jgi:hypothetical protein